MSEANAIVAALTREDEDGNAVYSREEVRHALPYLAITLDVPLTELGEGMQALVAQTLASAGGTVEGLQAHYAAHPVNAQLLEDVRRALDGDGLVHASPERATAAVTGASVPVNVIAPKPSDGPKERLAACAQALLAADARVLAMRLKGPRVEVTLREDNEDVRALVKRALGDVQLVLPIAWRTP